MNVDEEEEAHYWRVIEAFKTFASRSRRALRKHFDDLARLEESGDLDLIPEYADKLKELHDSVLEVNQVAFDTIIEATVPHHSEKNSNRLWPTDRDYENLRSLLRQMVRDWSVEGQAERDACYHPILASLGESFPSPQGIKVLIPGAGLGRLAYEMVQRGFSVQGNEFSLYMLLPSQYILNHSRPGSLAICPFAQPLSNSRSQADSHRVIRVPDCEIAPAPAEHVNFSMTAGDFLEVYAAEEEQSAWDCIVSCYFIDTATNVIAYLRRFWSLLKPGGRWINHGPLQYHFEGVRGEASIELSWEEVRLVAERIGFEFVDVKVINVGEKYASDKESLSLTQYIPIHSVAIKPRNK